MPLFLEEQLTMSQLLEDPVYRAWLDKVPVLTTHCFSGRPWRVWVQRNGRSSWGRQDFKKYNKALKFLLRLVERDDIHDLALTSKVQPFKPPVVRDRSLGLVKVGGEMVGVKRYHVPAFPGQNSAHHWCPHCRRPTIFTTFKKHHSFKHQPMLSYVRRCAVCGIAMTNIRIY